MGRKKKQHTAEYDAVNMPVQLVEVQNFMTEYDKELETNPQYSLDVDPQNLYSMDTPTKEFVKQYVQLKNISVAADLANVQIDDAKALFLSYPVQQEIRRINMAMYHRQFKAKLLSLEDIGRWLSALMIDDNVPLVDRLKPTEKLKVAQMLIDLHVLHHQAINNPQTIVYKDIETNVKKLSVDAIKALIYQDTVEIDNNNKEQVIKQLDKEKMLTPEEIAYLKTLTLDELLDVLNTSAKKI